MFDGIDRVDTNTFLCPRCRKQGFELDESGSAGALQKLRLTCVACRQPLERAVLPAMHESAGQGDVPPPPGVRPSQLWCDQPVDATLASPQGICWGTQFRVLERANELFSRCYRCGHGDSLGMINPAVG